MLERVVGKRPPVLTPIVVQFPAPPLSALVLLPPTLWSFVVMWLCSTCYAKKRLTSRTTCYTV